jgi:hypothetical protein
MVRSSDRSIVRPNNLFPAVMLPKFWSFDHSIVHRSSFVQSPYSSFFQIIFVLSLCYRNFNRSFVRSFDRSWFVRHFVRSFIRLFTNTIHHYYSSLLFTITIQHRYYSSLLFIDDICVNLFVVTIHRSSDHPKFQLLICHAVQST